MGGNIGLYLEETGSGNVNWI